MLVLTRKEGDWIAVGDEVVVRILSVKGQSVQIGVEAPRSLAVHRGEVREQILAETRAARESATDPSALRRLMKPPGTS